MLIFHTAVVTHGFLPTSTDHVIPSSLRSSLDYFGDLCVDLSDLAGESSSYAEFLTSASDIASFLTSFATDVATAKVSDLVDDDRAARQEYYSIYNHYLFYVFTFYEELAALEIGDKWSVDPSAEHDSPLYSEQLATAINLVQYAFATFHASYVNNLGCEAVYSSAPQWAISPGESFQYLYETYSNSSYSNTGKVHILAWPTILECYSDELAIVPPTANATNWLGLPNNSSSVISGGATGSISGSESEPGDETSAGSQTGESSAESIASEGSDSSSKSASGSKASSAAGSGSHTESSGAGGSSAATSSGPGSGTASSNGVDGALSASIFSISALFALLI